MNWDDLKIFLALNRAGTLSGAARALNVSQPTVGRRIERLERHMGTRLFDRLPDGYAPTAAGLRLMPLAEEMAEAAEALDRTSAALAERIEGTVRISVNEIIAQFLIDRLAGLRQALPEIEFELFVTHIQVNLSKREADLLIRDSLPELSSLTARKLGNLRYAIYGAPDYIESHPASRTERRYADCEWVGFDEDHGRFTGYTWLRERLGNRAPVHRTNNGMVLRRAVKAGAGLGVLPCYAAAGDPRLVRLTPPLDGVNEPLWLLVHPDMKRQPAIRAVMDQLIKLFADEKPALEGSD